MKDKLNKLTPNIVIIFLYMQPFLDILAGILIHNSIPNYFTPSVRILFMLYMIIYLIFSSYENKKKMLIYIGLLITCILIHTGIIITYKGTDILFKELKTTLTTYYFIFILISFYCIYKERKLNISHLRNIWFIYLILTFIPNILHIGFDSYWHSKLGSAGWFYSANVLGSILILLLPIILEELKKLKPIYLVITSCIFLYVIFSIGTKTPVLGLALIIGINLLYYMYIIIKNKEKTKLIITGFSLILLLSTSIFIIPKSSFYKNLVIHMEYLKKEEVPVLSTKFLDQFIFSERLTFEKNTRKYWNKSSLSEKLFGTGYIENYNKENQMEKTIEIDYFDIFYREGIIGFILYFTLVIKITIKCFKNTKLDFKRVNYICGVLLILLLALFQGHIFITPAISIYVALILVINSINIEENKV